LASLPANFSSRLFSRAVTQRIPAGKALFFAGDPGDGCYRLEKGLLKITLTGARISRPGCHGGGAVGA
jgi:CRP/FNR family transcriptional regulator, cyclic AMP receptor protein